MHDDVRSVTEIMHPRHIVAAIGYISDIFTSKECQDDFKATGLVS